MSTLPCQPKNMMAVFSTPPDVVNEQVVQSVVMGRALAEIMLLWALSLFSTKYCSNWSFALGFTFLHLNVTLNTP